MSAFIINYKKMKQVTAFDFEIYSIDLHKPRFIKRMFNELSRITDKYFVLISTAVTLITLASITNHMVSANPFY